MLSVADVVCCTLPCCASPTGCHRCYLLVVVILECVADDLGDARVQPVGEDPAATHPTPQPSEPDARADPCHFPAPRSGEVTVCVSLCPMLCRSYGSVAKPMRGTAGSGKASSSTAPLRLARRIEQPFAHLLDKLPRAHRRSHSGTNGRGRPGAAESSRAFLASTTGPHR